MHAYTVANTYIFTPIEDVVALKQELLKAMHQHHILGTFILAEEGMNAGFAGTAENVQAMYDYLHADARFRDLTFKESITDEMPFEKAKVKLRNEIVTMGVPNTTALDTRDTHLSPEAWNALLEDPEVILVDTRNHYEVAIGRFENATDPKTDTFKDFPDYVEKNLLDKKDKKIAMYCTGGIRCEKSTAHLKQLGFKYVYQLDGGILTYLEQIPEEKSKWDGQCFVFDERIAI